MTETGFCAVKASAASLRNAVFAAKCGFIFQHISGAAARRPQSRPGPLLVRKPPAITLLHIRQHRAPGNSHRHVRIPPSTSGCKFRACNHHEGPVPDQFAQHLLGEEHHRVALAAALGLPELAAAPVAQAAGFEHRGDGVVYAEELVVLADDLHQPGLVFGEQREVLHQIEQAAALAGAAQHHLQRHAPRLVLALDTLPLHPALPVGGK